MNGQRSSEYLEGLLRELRALPRETEWLEFKESHADPQEIGEYISALANSAALAGKATAYLVWGVRDGDHAVVGTAFDPRLARKGNEELENWLLRLLDPKIDFHFHRLETEAGPVVLTEIARATQHPVRFSGREYIRVGSYKKNLKDYPQKERALWRMNALKEREDTKGYACGFEGLNAYVHALLPENEVIEQALRRTVPMFPLAAVRELLANALIHQDLSVAGAGPMVEIFDKRMEITNPGAPLINIERFLDAPPRSRNDKLASLMRRLNICEERGSGIDKVVLQVELFQLPAPLFEQPGDATRATLFAHKSLRDMGRQERIRACYFHACLNHVLGKPVTNSSIRQRFGIPGHNASTASRLLNEAVDAGVLAVEANGGTKSRRYVPFWAVQASDGPMV